MAVIKAFLFALLVVNIQSSFAFNEPISSTASPELRRVISKERSSLQKAVERDIIKKEQCDAVVHDLLTDAKRNVMTIFTKVDLALGKAAARHVITPAVRAKILTHGVAKNLHLRTFNDLKFAVSVYLDSAKKADIIDEETASYLKGSCPSAVVPDGDAAISPEYVY